MSDQVTGGGADPKPIVGDESGKKDTAFEAVKAEKRALAEENAKIKAQLEKSGKLRIGIDPGSDIVGRVQGNVLGTYGNAEPVTKGRDFLGITQKDLDGILANYPLDDKEEREDRITNLVASELVSRNIISKVKIDGKKDEDDE